MSRQAIITLKRIPFETIKIFVQMIRKSKTVILPQVSLKNGNLTYEFNMLHITFFPKKSILGNLHIIGDRAIAHQYHSDLVKLNHNFMRIGTKTADPGKGDRVLRRKYCKC